MNRFSNFSLVFCAFIFLFNAFPAYAYIGPGLGVVAIWGVLGPLAGVLALLLMLAYFPARYYYKKWKYGKKASEDETAPSEEIVNEKSSSADEGKDK
ncbi:MAG: hypothetical protein ACLFR0_03020 [Alphaproteobacteria bacterium]